MNMFHMLSTVLPFGRFCSCKRRAMHSPITEGTWNKLGLVVLLLLNLSLLSSPVFAQTAKGLINGTVTDASGGVIKGAQIELAPLGLIVYSDEVGSFTFPMVPVGPYTVRLSAAGFKTQDTRIDLVAGKVLTLDLKLAVGSTIEQILVTAERPHGEMEAIDETRAADNIQQILPAEVIVSLPNANVADAVGRLPSVTLQRNEGEGEYVQVRGTEPRLTNITVDGITVPAPEATVRAVRLDVIPSDMVEHVDINKTLSANMDAEGIGSSVDIRTKEAQDKPTVNLYMNGGRTDIMGGRFSGGTGGTVGKRFGTQKKLGLLGNASFDFNGRGIDDNEPAIDPLSRPSNPFYDNTSIRQYRYYRYRYGYSGSFDYKFNDVSSIYMRGFDSTFKDWGNKWYYEPVSDALSLSNPLDPTSVVYPSTALVDDKAKFYTSTKSPVATIGTILLGGREIHPNWWLIWEGSVSRSSEIAAAGNPKADFQWLGSKFQCNYAQTGPTLTPQFQGCTGANSPMEVAADWGLKDITIPDPKGISSQLNLTGAVNFARNYVNHGHFGTLQLGFKIGNAHKLNDAVESVYDNWAKGPVGGPYTMTALQGYFQNNDFYGGNYLGGHFGPVTDFTKTQNYVQTNFLGYLDQDSTDLDNWPNLFGIIERVTAGYAMNTIDINKFHIQAGLRLEQTTMRTKGYSLLIDPTIIPSTCTNSTRLADLNVVCPVSSAPSYLNAMPDVQIRYKLTADSGLRISYGRGIARPDPYQMIPYVSMDDTGTPTKFTVGNSALRPEFANNYDVLYEHFLKPIGMLQAGVFYKQLTAPQLTTIIPQCVALSSLPAGTIDPGVLTVINADVAAGITMGNVSNCANGNPNVTVTTDSTGENSTLYGIELSYSQHLTYLPSVLGGLGITANYGYSNSRLKGNVLRTDHPRLLDEANNTWNLSPTYDTKHLSVRAGLEYNGSSIFDYEWVAPAITGTLSGADPSNLGPKGPSGDIWMLPHLQVDAQASYRVYHGLSVQVSGLNLTNEVFGFYQGSPVFENQREFYKPTYAIGLRYVFGVK